MKLHISAEAEALASACAAFIAEQAEASIQGRGQFNIALSGGHTPADTYLQLSLPPHADLIDWSKVHVFWSDDRCVPPNSPESNYRLANETLLQRVPLPAENIHRMRGELAPQEAAAQARQDLEDHFGEQWPSFDLVLLGLGEDGHTASLFPDTEALTEIGKSVVANHVTRLDAWRLTFTYPLINKARQIVFLTEGEAKAQMVKEVANERNPQRPASKINPVAGELHWFIDQAAGQLVCD